MTPEQRLDRLERIAKLLVKAGKSAETDEKFARLAESHAHSGRRLDALIEVIRREHEGDAGKS